MDYSGLLKKICQKGAEFSDIRLSNSTSEVVSLENGNLNLVQKDISRLYGARVFYKGARGFAYGTDFNKAEKALQSAFKLAKSNSKRLKEKFKLSNFGTFKANIKSKGTSFTEVELDNVVKKLLECDSILNKKPVVNRNVDAGFSRKNQAYFNSFGSNIEQTREYFNFRFAAVGKKSGNLRKVFDKVGMCASYDDFEKIEFEKMIKTQLNLFPELFRAKKAPAGNYPLIMDPVLSHVFFHEAVGHACEADAILENSSVLKDAIGKKIGPVCLTLSDDARIEKEHGFFKYDDEGMKSNGTILIKNGILNNYLHSIETASRLGMKPTGNCRAENASSFPYPRMSNIVLHDGKYKFQELFEGIKKGIYAKSSTGGVVEPTNGNFLFNTKEAYLIENGKITKPVLDVSFGGNILQILPKIEKVANDSKVVFGGWSCGKKGQMVPVGGKSPHIKISEVMVGGQNE